MKSLWVNGSLQVDHRLGVPAIERGIAVFETMRSRSRIVFRAAAHLGRLQASCALLGLDCPPMERLLEYLEQARVASFGERVIRMQVGQGLCMVRSAPLDQGRLARPLSLVCKTPGQLDLDIASAKHCSRAAWERGAAQAGVDEVLWVVDGLALETHQGNILAQVGDTLVTPPLDGRILPGVTRGALIQAAGEAGIPLQVRPLGVEEIQALWVSSTLKELAPVHHLDHCPLNEGILGQPLLRAFRAVLARETAPQG